MRVYFAHPVTEYNTSFESKALKLLERTFDEVVNPNGPGHEERYREFGFAYFELLCTFCDACVFSRFSNGLIGAGVAKEVQTFLERGAPVFEYVYMSEAGGFVLKTVESLPPHEILTIDATRALIKNIREARIAYHSNTAA